MVNTMDFVGADHERLIERHRESVSIVALKQLVVRYSCRKSLDHRLFMMTGKMVS